MAHIPECWETKVSHWLCTYSRFHIGYVNKEISKCNIQFVVYWLLNESKVSTVVLILGTEVFGTITDHWMWLCNFFALIVGK